MTIDRLKALCEKTDIIKFIEEENYLVFKTAVPILIKEIELLREALYFFGGRSISLTSDAFHDLAQKSWEESMERLP